MLSTVDFLEPKSPPPIQSLSRGGASKAAQSINQCFSSPSPRLPISLLTLTKVKFSKYGNEDNNAFGHSFRDYEKESERRAGVEEFYRVNHINQTYSFAKRKKEEYGKLEKAEMSIWECIELLNEFVDLLDPDLDEPQIEHLLQSAEAIRRNYPNEDWLHLTALIHDLGKVLLHPSFGSEPQWCVVGDTFPLKDNATPESPTTGLDNTPDHAQFYHSSLKWEKGRIHPTLLEMARKKPLDETP